MINKQNYRLTSLPERTGEPWAQNEPQRLRGFWEEGGERSTRNLFWHLNNYTVRICLVYYFGTLGSIEGLLLPGGSLKVKLKLILANFGW